MMGVEVIFRGNIKPSSPTPENSRIYKLSILDQAFPSFYVNWVLFYLNNQNINKKDVVSTRLKHLRLSLSATLTRFYPFAGRIIDDLHIDCNDGGVNYVEARIMYNLPDLLMQPNEQLINQLLPKFNKIHQEEMSSSRNHVMLMQVNVFDCGGIAIGVSTSHKIFDALTATIFMKAWAATANEGSSSNDQQIYPDFSMSSLFPQNSSLVYEWPLVNDICKSITRRFVFDASSLASLKSTVTTLVQRPSRIEVVTALLWKCTIEAAYKARIDGEYQPKEFTPPLLSVPINLRTKKSPPLSQYSVGNCIVFAYSKCQLYSKLELSSLVECTREVVAKLNDDFVDEMTGSEGFQKTSSYLKESWDLRESVGKGNLVCVTSFSNSGLYEPDFGWGKPAWFFITGLPIASLIILVDTRSGDGIEAFVTLPEQDMAIFQRDPQLLAFTSVDPSPLQLYVSSSSRI